MSPTLGWLAEHHPYVVSATVRKLQPRALSRHAVTASRPGVRDVLTRPARPDGERGPRPPSHPETTTDLPRVSPKGPRNGVFRGILASYESAYLQVFSRSMASGRGIIIRVSGVRVPPPASAVSARFAGGSRGFRSVSSNRNEPLRTAQRHDARASGEYLAHGGEGEELGQSRRGLRRHGAQAASRPPFLGRGWLPDTPDSKTPRPSSRASCEDGWVERVVTRESR